MRILMVRTSCKTTYNVLSHSHDCQNYFEGWVDLWGGGLLTFSKRDSLQILDLQRLTSLRIHTCKELANSNQNNKLACWFPEDEPGNGNEPKRLP